MSVPPVPPAIVIELEIEAAPRVRVRASNEGEEHRVVDWINSRDELADIVARALNLAEEQPAA
jgi:hypothetical protein